MRTLSHAGTATESTFSFLPTHSLIFVADMSPSALRATYACVANRPTKCAPFSSRSALIETPFKRHASIFAVMKYQTVRSHWRKVAVSSGRSGAFGFSLPARRDGRSFPTSRSCRGNCFAGGVWMSSMRHRSPRPLRSKYSLRVMRPRTSWIRSTSTCAQEVVWSSSPIRANQRSCRTIATESESLARRTISGIRLSRTFDFSWMRCLQRRWIATCSAIE